MIWPCVVFFDIITRFIGYLPNYGSNMPARYSLSCALHLIILMYGVDIWGYLRRAQKSLTE